MATEVVLHGTIRLDSKIRSQNVHFHDSFCRGQNLAAIFFLTLTRIDFAVSISSRTVRVFPALSLRRVRPSYGTFSLMVFQRNCSRGRTGHMIKSKTFQLDVTQELDQRLRKSKRKKSLWLLIKMSFSLRLKDVRVGVVTGEP